MSTPDQHLRAWRQQEELAERMIPLIGTLYRNQGVVLTIFGRPLVHCSTIEIVRRHRFARQILEHDLPLQETFPLIEGLSRLELCPTEIDLAKLSRTFASQQDPLDRFLQHYFAGVIARPGSGCPSPRDLVLYGFGRIGRLLTRLLVEKTGGGGQLRLRAIVVRKGSADDLAKRASLLRRDSVHGPFNGSIRLDEKANALIVNGHMIHVLHADAPDAVDYSRYGIHQALLIDNTGAWRDRAGLERHLASDGIDQVLLTAPGKGDIPNIVFGINQGQVPPGERIVSAASCTTNAAAPVLKAMADRFGIVHGHIETCHSYTNDQNLLDNFHKKERRGRSAPLNMVITETGAAKAVAKVLPELAGRLTGNSIRVPTPNVSLAILNLELGRETTAEEINSHLRQMSLHSPLQEQIDYTNSTEVVSSDFVGSRQAGVVDARATIAQGRHCVVYVWYDNEFGYSVQVVRLATHLAGLELASSTA
jgi:glyceraldehyde 3-phosphate dehydrogenase